jgi:hypothetical protein
MFFGWVMGLSDGQRVVACAGPAFGTPVSSYRSEDYGMCPQFGLCIICFASAVAPQYLKYITTRTIPVCRRMVTPPTGLYNEL